MEKKSVILIVLVVIFVALVSVGLFGYNNYSKVLSSIDKVYSASHNMVDNNEKKKINLKNDTEKAIYEYFVTIYNKKEDASKNSYTFYERENIGTKIYRDTNEVINTAKEYSENEFKEYEELKDVSKREKFINHLKDKKIHNLLIKHLDKKVDNYVIDEGKINDLINSEKEKFDDLIKYLDYLESSKDRWYYSNKILICKDEEILKTIEEKNKELNLDIKIMLESSNEEKVKKIPVLMYHGVSDVTWGIANLFMKVNDFEEQLKYINENFETIFMEDIDKFGSKKAVVLTFDDGYVDFYTNVLPLLKKYNMKANLYVIDNADGGVYLTKDQIKEIADSGLVSIGSHTETHATLTNLSTEKLDYEFRESKQNLEQLIGKEVKTICYPTGAYNNRVLEYAAKYYEYGLVIDHGVQKMYDGYNKLAVRRFRVYRNTSFSSFKKMVDQAN